MFRFPQWMQLFSHTELEETLFTGEGGNTPWFAFYRVEKYWSWVRWSLRQKDMADLVAKRPPITKFAFKRRVQNLFRSRRSQQVAAACAGSLRKTALEVIRVKGAAAKG